MVSAMHMRAIVGDFIGSMWVNVRHISCAMAHVRHGGGTDSNERVPVFCQRAITSGWQIPAPAWPSACSQSRSG